MRTASFGATLEWCSDPDVLVPGSPSALRADADHLQQQARALAQQAVEIREARAENWTGATSEAWAARRSQYVQTVDTVAQIHDTAAATLRLHADALEWGQDRVSVAVRMYAEGCRLRDAELGTTGGSLAAGSVLGPPDAGAGHRALAHDILASAREQVAASGRAAAEVLNQLAEGLPDGRWHLGDFAAGVWSWISGIATLIWKFNSIRAMVDPRGVLRDGRGIADGAAAIYESFIDDPFETSKRLAQLDMLRDHPARWWGQLAPDIVLAAAGGAGVGTKALRGVAVAEEMGAAAEDLSAVSRRMYEVGSRWDDPQARETWLREYTAGEPGGNPNLRHVPLTKPEHFYQHGQTGPFEVRFTTNGKVSWADGVQLDADSVAAVEVKFSGTPGKSPYTGTAPEFIQTEEMRRFEGQIRQYGQVIADEGNPVGRLRLVTNEQAVADFLGPRARAVLGPDVDFQIVVRPD